MSQKTFQNITPSSVSHSSFQRNGTCQPRLPSELLGAILEPFAGKSGKRDLLNAALAFEALRNESQRILFRSVVIPEGITERRSLKNLIRQCAFFSAIVNAPERLGPYVQTVASEYLTTAPVESNLHSKESISAHGQDSYRQATMRLYNLTFLAFPHLIHLKHLTFASLNMGHDWRKNTSIRLLRSCTFSLNSLSWHRPQDLPILASDFFPHQQSIQSFYMRGDFSNGVMIPSEVLPKLRLLYASSHLLLALLPGRHVKSVTWAESTGEPDALIEAVSELLTGVEYLAISHNQTLQNVPVSRNLLSVKVLCLKTYDRANWVRLPCYFLKCHA